jgi:sortase A
MGKWIGAICVFLGVVCILSAIGFVAYNQWEAENAQKSAQDLLKDVQSIIAAPQPDRPLPEDTGNLPEDTERLPEDTVDLPEDTEKVPAEMATVEVDGYDCIGILSVPVLGLELPVLTDWSYTKLKKAPCHYYGSYYETDFVIAAHNYRAHFGRLSELQAGDIVIFTNVHGVALCYEVALLETLPPTATEEMITSGFPLSLYTCTPGGGNRVTAHCNFANTKK